MNRTLTAALALAAALAAAPVRADEAAPGAEQGNVERPRVRASHHVDVIAPGERVQTVLDRMRASRAVDERQPSPGRSTGGKEEAGHGGTEEPDRTEMGGTGQPQLRPDARPDGGHHHEGMRPKG